MLRQELLLGRRPVVHSRDPGHNVLRPSEGEVRLSTGFAYVMSTVTPAYAQEASCNVPAQWGDRLYFGPCKIPMRPRMQAGDLIFAVSPSVTSPRRLLFAAEIEERITFREAFERFPELHGPPGPIHVRPVRRTRGFPESDYEFIEGSVHGEKWQADLASRGLDAFFVCRPAAGWRNRWLGSLGPVVDDAVVAVLNQHPVYGSAGLLASHNQGTPRNPIAHGGMYSGLHVEIGAADALLDLVELRMAGVELPGITDTPRLLGGTSGKCTCSRSAEAPAVEPSC